MIRGSVVEYMYDAAGPKPYKCGYCRSPNTSLTQGLLGYNMTCKDYQDLVDRGFQRSGRYVYRADMKRTCCPQYVIRMDVTEFSVTKAQKRAIRRFNEYLLHGTRYDDRKTPLPMEEEGEDEEGGPSLSVGACPENTGDGALMASSAAEERSMDQTEIQSRKEDEGMTDHFDSRQSKKGKPKKTVRPGVGADPTKPPCRKAKLLRKERKAKKLEAKMQQLSQMESKTDSTGSSGTPVDKVVDMPINRTPPAPSSSKGEGTDSGAVVSKSKTKPENDRKGASGATPQKFKQDLKQILALPNKADCKHKFETRLINIKECPNVFLETFQESYTVFKKFQMIIHREKEEDSTGKHFDEFLVQSPLENNEEGCENMPCSFGTYHLQYLLDGKIFAVGVIDILPRGLLCEYLYYDPEYRFIAPGVYTALHEIAFTQELFQLNPEMQYYYMGFYVQSCPKMNYKSRYNAGYLLCPETYQYVPIARCVPKLKASPYSRLADDDVPDAKEGCTEEQLDSLRLFFNMQLTTYEAYKFDHDDSISPMLREYIDVVGIEVASRMTLVVSRRSLFQ